MLLASTEVPYCCLLTHPQATFCLVWLLLAWCRDEESDQIGFRGWARMAAPIAEYTIIEVRKPKVGENKPADVTADIVIDTSSKSADYCPPPSPPPSPLLPPLLCTLQGMTHHVSVGSAVHYVHCCCS